MTVYIWPAVSHSCLVGMCTWYMDYEQTTVQCSVNVCKHDSLRRNTKLKIYQLDNATENSKNTNDKNGQTKQEYENHVIVEMITA